VVRLVVPIQIQIDAKGVLAKLNKLGYFVRIDVPRLTFAQAERGAQHAAQIAPHDTGALIQAIGVAQTEGGRRSEGWAVVSRTPPNLGISKRWGKPNNPRNFPYHAVLEYGRAVNIYEGRTQRYMQATALWLEEQYPELIKKGLSNAIK
jgi:hypothetical protein